MRIVEDSPDRLVIEDRPIILGTLFVVIVIFFVAAALWTVADAPAVAFGALLGAVLMGICFAVFVRRVFVIFDRAADALVIRTASVFGQTVVQLRLPDIAEAVVETTTSIDDHDSTTARTLMHRPALRLTNGRPNQPLTQIYSGGKGASKAVDAINRWLVSSPAA